MSSPEGKEKEETGIYAVRNPVCAAAPTERSDRINKEYTNIILSLTRGVNSRRDKPGEDDLRVHDKVYRGCAERWLAPRCAKPTEDCDLPAA